AALAIEGAHSEGVRIGVDVPARESQFFSGPHAEKLVGANRLLQIVGVAHSIFRLSAVDGSRLKSEYYPHRDRQAAALFLIAPMTAVSTAPPAPPATACEIMPPILRLPDCAATIIDGSNNVTIWPSTPPPTKPEITLPIIPRSKVGDDLPAPTP